MEKDKRSRNLIAGVISLVFAVATFLVGFVYINIKSNAATFTHDEQKVYDFLVQVDTDNVTNAAKLGITDLTDSSQWVVNIGSGIFNGFHFDTGGNLIAMGSYYTMYDSYNTIQESFYGSLDLSGCVMLQYIGISSGSSGGIYEIDVAGCVSLEVLSSYGNPLTGLDVSGNALLKELSCGGSQLTEIDVSGNLALESLGFSNNQLTELDVSNNLALESLTCSYNQLTELDVSGNLALKELYCRNNQLTELDVSSNAALEYLDCSSNQLTELDVSGLSLRDFEPGNELTKLNLSGFSGNIIRGILFGTSHAIEINVSGYAGTERWGTRVWGVVNTITRGTTYIEIKSIFPLLYDPMWESFILVPEFTEPASGHTTVSVSLGTRRLTLDINVTSLNYITAVLVSVNVNPVTGVIDFNVCQEPYGSRGRLPLLGFSEVSGLSMTTRETEGVWEKFSAIMTDDEMVIELFYQAVSLDPGESLILYNNVPGEQIFSNPNPLKYTEGVGVAVLEDLETTDTHTFIGWYDAEENGEPVTSISDEATGTVTLWAYWDPRTFGIEYISEHTMTHQNNLQYIYGVGISELAAPEDIEGYIFEGWYTDPEFTMKIDSIDEYQFGEVTLYAHWVLEGQGGDDPPGPDLSWLQSYWFWFLLTLIITTVVYSFTLIIQKYWT